MNNWVNRPLANLQSLIDLIKIKQDLSDVGKLTEFMEEIKSLIGKLSQIAEGDLKKRLLSAESKWLY